MKNDVRHLTPQKVKVQVGDEERGGYAYRMRLKCAVDLSALTDVQRLQAFIDHQRKECGCYVKA